ncbi:MAG: PC4/YdbC family ssDNA-binding protein [Syntrophomonadaceae bacterium]
MSDLKFEIIETLGVLSEGSRGWQKEVNLISWNGRSPKLDVRDWSPDHQRMGKGLTFTRDELIKLRDFINSLDLEELELD